MGGASNFQLSLLCLLSASVSSTSLLLFNAVLGFLTDFQRHLSNLFRYAICKPDCLDRRCPSSANPKCAGVPNKLVFYVAAVVSCTLATGYGSRAYVRAAREPGHGGLPDIKDFSFFSVSMFTVLQSSKHERPHNKRSRFAAQLHPPRSRKQARQGSIARLHA